eukprot:TRINITY_DN18256_c0_g6_i1.p1 TRINITY_DN18256_c0_g6~~TRINITY_DN18256_c0_g6_i1.p1  ORF type:complete len:1092 (-),score=346.29 TRINITY_DN18256_c0_g6_i1:247-3522(-)
MLRSLVGSEMCIRDSINAEYGRTCCSPDGGAALMPPRRAAVIPSSAGSSRFSRSSSSSSPQWGQHMASGSSPPSLARSRVRSLNGSRLDHQLCAHDEQVRDLWLEKFLDQADGVLSRGNPMDEAAQCELAVQKVCQEAGPDFAVYHTVLSKIMSRYNRLLTRMAEDGKRSTLTARRSTQLTQSLKTNVNDMEKEIEKLKKEIEEIRGATPTTTKPDLTEKVAHTLKVAGLKGELQRKQDALSNQMQATKKMERESDRVRRSTMSRYTQLEENLKAAENDIKESEKISLQLEAMVEMLPHMIPKPEPPAPAQPDQTDQEVQVDVDDGLEAELEAMRMQMNKTAQSNAQLRAKMAGMTPKVDKSDEPKEEREDFEDKFKKESQKLQQLQKLHQQLTDQLQHSKDTVAQLERKVEGLEKKIAELMMAGDQACKQLQIKLSLAVAERDELLERVKELEEQVEKLQRQLDEFMRTSGDNQKLLDMIAELQKSNGDLEKDLQRVNQEVEDLRTKLKALEKALEETEVSEVSVKGSDTDRAVHDELAKLQMMFENLQKENAGLRAQIAAQTKQSEAVPMKNKLSQTDDIAPTLSQKKKEPNNTVLRSQAAQHTAAQAPALGNIHKRNRRVVDLRNAPKHTGRVLSLKEVNKLIIKYYLEKIAADQVDDLAGNQRATLSEFCYDQLFNRYGLRKLAQQHLMELVGTVRKFKDSSWRVQIFGRLVGLFDHCEAAETACNFLLGTIELLQDTLSQLKVATDGRCTISLPVAVALLPSVFRVDTPEGIEEAMRTVVAKAIFLEDPDSLEHALVDLDDYLEICMNLWEAHSAHRLKFLNQTYEEIRGDQTGVRDLESFKKALLAVGMDGKPEMVLRLFNKCLRMDSGDLDDDEETVSQASFVAVAFEALHQGDESDWQIGIGGKLTACMFENRMGLTAVWRSMDQNGNGTVDVSEFRSAIKQICITLSHSEVLELIKMVTAGKNQKTINYMEFIRRFQPIFAATLRHELGQDWDERVVQKICDAVYQQHSQLRDAFELFDVSGDGRISSSEFGGALEKLGITGMDEGVCAAIVMLMDNDGDGEVSYEEFLKAFRIVDVQSQVN